MLTALLTRDIGGSHSIGETSGSVGMQGIARKVRISHCDLDVRGMEGRAIPAAYLTDAWEKERVEYSVERCNLDFLPLMDKRKAVWAECWSRVQEYLQELETYQNDEKNAIARDRFKQALKRVRELMREDQELSAVARACVLSSGDPRVTGILQSA
jgi:hypothetical protein